MKEPHRRIQSLNDASKRTQPSQMTSQIPRQSQSIKILQYRKKQWVDRSLTYYSTVSRKERRIAKGQYHPRQVHWKQHRITMDRAIQLYHARQQIKVGKMNVAEKIYRRLILELIEENQDMTNENSTCDAELAISTLLLALLLQRKGQVKETRKVFIQFFRNQQDRGGDYKCTCSAKVFQAYALFEMKSGNTRKAYSIAELAVQMDDELAPILQWKQFRDVVPIVSSNHSHGMADLHP